MNALPLALALAVHIAAIAAWTGGMAYALLVARPAIAGLEPAQRIAVHGGLLKRFILVVWHAMPLTILSGGFLVWWQWGGFALAPWPVHAMTGLAVLMTGVFLVLAFGPYKAFRRAISPNSAAAPLARVRLLMTVNLALGVVTIVIAALAPQG